MGDRHRLELAESIVPELASSQLEGESNLGKKRIYQTSREFPDVGCGITVLLFPEIATFSLVAPDSSLLFLSSPFFSHRQFSL